VLLYPTILIHTGELLARRRTPFGIVGAMVVGFLAIVLVVGVLHWHIAGEPYLNQVPLITSILAAAVLVALCGAPLRIAMPMATIRATTTGVAAMCAGLAGTGR
jgi:uncharacterized membrane protein YeaQ/YmgE (transglycosylase-associated protein family)